MSAIYELLLPYLPALSVIAPAIVLGGLAVILVDEYRDYRRQWK